MCPCPNPTILINTTSALFISCHTSRMSRSIEVELRFRIQNPEEIKIFVKNLKVIEEKRIVDVYLDTEDGELFKRGIFIRLRNGKKIDIKFNKEEVYKSLDEHIEHTHCDEVSHPLPLTHDALAS